MMHRVKYMLFSICLLILSSCSSETETRYSGNPKAVLNAMKQCPENPPKGVSCEKLTEMATRINQLAYKLRLDQQAYGKDVLALQETITAQRSALEKQPNEALLQQNLKENERNLQEHLAVVRWLASPDSH